MKKALALILVTLVAGQPKSQSVDGPTGKSGSSSGWIPIQVTTNRVLVPVIVNGHPATANFVDGITTRIDKGFIDNNNILVTNTPGQPPSSSLSLQFGGVTVSQAVNAVVFSHQNSNPPVDLIAGDEVFKELVVDIDLSNQRIAFYRPDRFIPPTGVTPLVFKQDGDSRAVSVSMEQGPPMFYWVYMGDPAAISVYHAYSTSHKMLQERVNSVRMGGGPRAPPEAIATVSRVNLAGTEFNQVPGVFPDDSVTGAHPEEVAGHIGLGILSRCRVIFDYSHDRLYIIPGPPSAIKAPFPKDRSGLVMKKVRDDYVVRYVCPGSPAMKAGFQVGDTVIQVNSQPMPALLGTAWQTAAWGNVRLTDLGTTFVFTLKDKSVRKLTTAEYF
jgi:hypothetical protein